MGDTRFTPAYVLVRDAANRVATIRALSDEDVIAALAGASREGDELVSNFLATEAMNRVRRGRRVIETMAEGVIATDGSGNVTMLNPAAERSLHVQREEVLGRPVNEVLRSVGGPGMTQPLTSGVPFTEDHGAYITREDEPIHLRLTAVPLIHEGDLMGEVVTFQVVGEET